MQSLKLGISLLISPFLKDYKLVYFLKCTFHSIFLKNKQFQRKNMFLVSS